MGERKLNFNSPLLSVRRYSMPASSSSDKGRNIQNSLSNRRHTLPSSDSDLNMDQVTEPVAVPFTWEHIPGKAKNSHEKSKLLLLEGPSVSPRLPPQRSREFAVARHLEGPSSNNIAAKLDSFKHEITDEKEADFEDDDDDDDDDEDAYSDAVETLSPAESLSFSVNYSVSGLSGTDGPVVKPSGTFSVDSHTRDFMMNRFLPAARAMALEPPQYSSRKQPARTEQTRDVKKLTVSETPPPPKQYSMEIVQYYKQDTWEEESVDDDEDKGEQDNDYGSISAKGCGLLPRLGLLNTTLGMKPRARSPMSFMFRMKGVSEDGHARSQSQPKKAGHEHKLDHGHPTPKLPGIKNRLLSSSSRFNFSGELRTGGGLSPYRRSRNDSVAPQQKGPALPPAEGFGFLGLSKEANNIDASTLKLLIKKVDSMQKVSSKHTTNQGNGLVSPATEKTLYVDTVNTEAKPCCNSSSSNSELLLIRAAEDVEHNSDTRKTEENVSKDSSFHDIECLDFKKPGTTLGQDLSLPIDANPSSCFTTLTGQGETMCISADGDSNINTTLMVKKADKEEIDVTSLPLPLLKSPSESWLCRTLPSIPSRYPLLHSTTTTCSKKQDLKVSGTDTKWETIVKTSNLHHDHVRYSQELISHVSQQTKF